MRIKNWLGAGTLASAACLLAACYGGDPSAMTEAELAGYGMPGLAGSSNLAVTPATDLSKGAACVQTVRALDLECPGLSQAESAAIQAAVQPKLMSLAPLLRVTVMRTGGQVFARIDGGEEHGQTFENTFGTSSLVVPVQADGSFQITVPVAESEGRFGGMAGMPGAGAFGMQPTLGGLGQFGIQPGMAGLGARGIGGGPTLGLGLQPGLTGQFGTGGLLGQSGWGSPMTTLSSPFGGLGGSACPCPGATPQVTYTAYGVEARLRGHIDLANVQFVPDATGQTETAVLVDDQALQMQGEIGLVPIQPGLEPGAPGGQQAVPPIAQRGLMGGQFGAPQLGGAYGGHLVQTTPQAGIGQQQVFQGVPQQACPAPQVTAAPAVECRIPLQMCTSCGVDTGAAEPTIITAPNIPEPACPQLIVRPVQAPCPCP